MGEDLQSWLARAVEHFQKHAHSAMGSQLEMDFTAPCQVVGFATRNPLWQGFAVFHLETAQNGLILTFEDLDPWELSKAVGKAFQDPLWNHVLEGEDVLPGTTLRDVAFQILDGLLQGFRSGIFIEPPRREDPFWSAGRFAGGCAAHQRRGPLTSEPEVYVDEVLESARREAEATILRRAEAALAPAPEAAGGIAERTPGAHGILLRPALRIGQLQSNDISDWYRERDHTFPGPITAQAMLGPYPLLATSNGFLALRDTTPDEAAHWLNLAMAGLLAEGFPASVVRRSELAAVHPPDETQGFWGGSYPQRRQADYRSWVQHWIGPGELQAVIAHAERLDGTDLARHVPLFLEAHTHLQNTDYTESFVYSWALIEQQVSRRWTDFVASRKASARRKEKLQGGDWTVHVRSEAMNLAGEFPDALLHDLNKVRKARNDIMHGDRLADQSDATRALDLAEALLARDGPALRGKPRERPLFLGWI